MMCCGATRRFWTDLGFTSMLATDTPHHEKVSVRCRAKKCQKFGATLPVGVTGVHARRGLGWCVCPLGISNVVKISGHRQPPDGDEPRPVLFFLIEAHRYGEKKRRKKE